MCGEYMSSSGEDAELSMMVHAFITMQWNLLQRANTIDSLVTNGIDVDGDHLVVNIAKMKNDQTGERAYPRALHANTTTPAICPILALAIYFFSTNNEHNCSKKQIFHNGSNRFCDWLSRIMKIAKSELHLENVDIGSHSVRKGGVTYSSNKLDGPKSHCVWHRAGWLINGTIDVYLLDGGGGDQETSRILSLIFDHGSISFAQLPPHFSLEVVNHERINLPSGETIYFSDIISGWTSLPESFKKCMPMLLARLVHAEDFLREKLPPYSKLFQSTIWNLGIISDLRPLVVTGLFEDRSNNMTCTGVPFRYYEMNDKRQQREEVRSLSIFVKDGEFADQVVSKCMGRLVINGAVPLTEADIRKAMSEENSKLLNEFSRTAQDAKAGGSGFGMSVPSHNMYYYNDSFHPVPEGFFANSTSIELVKLWDLWWSEKVVNYPVGNSFYTIPGFRVIKSGDITSKRRPEWSRVKRSIQLLVEKGLIEKNEISAYAHPDQHPDIIKSDLAGRQALYKTAYKNILGREPDTTKSVTYVSFYDSYNKTERSKDGSAKKRKRGKVNGAADNVNIITDNTGAEEETTVPSKKSNSNQLDSN